MMGAQIVLLGLRGCGKSTIGARLAARRGESFIDLDGLVTARLGCATVREAWATRGEPAFRAAEVEALRSVIGQPGTVLALGGGTPTAPGAADVLSEAKAENVVRLIYLRASAPALRSRLDAAGVGDRPALRPGADGGTGDPLAEIEAVLVERDPLYQQLADAVVEVGALDEDKAVNAVVSACAG